MQAVQSGEPVLSAIAVDGAAVDASAPDKGSLRDDGLKAALACGAAGPGWSPLEAYLAAGYSKWCPPYL